MINSILHVSEDHSIHNTGITSAVDGLARQLAGTFSQEILSIGPQFEDAPPGVELFLLRSGGVGRAWRMAASQGDTLRAFAGRAGVIHLHGVWMWPQWAAARAARQFSKPFILTAHGMLEAWTWERQSWIHRLKKWLYWQGLAYPAFRHAALVHALTPNEADTLRGYFPNQAMVTIPNGVPLDSIDQELAGLPQRETAEAPYFLFLGRLHPIKGIHLLIQAFAQLPQTEFRLKIAGPTQQREAAYAASLPRLAESLGLAERVQFIGRVEGAEKWRLYRDAWAFCLPTFSEVIGLVNLEAAACATPVLTTPNSGVLSAWETHGGMLLQPQVQSLAAGLAEAVRWSVEERERRGILLRRLVETEYTWQAVLPQWVKVYDQLMKSNNANFRL
jgi:glycosyltransferase involved in cell wall biosynthesis